MPTSPHLARVDPLPFTGFREEVIWLAGLWEGEGHFGYSRLTLRITLGMTDLDVVERVHRLMRPRTKILIRAVNPIQRMKQPLYIVNINAEQALAWMWMLYPFLGQRKRLAIRGVLEKWRRRPIAKQHRERCPLGHLYLVKRKGDRQRRCAECNRQSGRRRYLRRRELVSPAQAMLL